MSDVINNLIPFFLSAVVSILGWVFTRAMIAVRERFGAETERLLRDELGKAMQRGIAKATTEFTDPVLQADRAARYVQETMPDTVERLGANSTGLTRRAYAELALLTSQPGGKIDTPPT